MARSCSRRLLLPSTGFVLFLPTNDVGDAFASFQVMVLSMDAQRGRVTLSTKKLEPTPGDMLRDPQLVFEKAEEMAEAFKKRVEAAGANARSQAEMGGYGAAAPYGGEAAAAGGDF